MKVKRRHYIAKNGDSTFLCGLLRPNTKAEAKKFGEACFRGSEDKVTCPRCENKLKNPPDMIVKADPYEEGRESMRKEIADRLTSFLEPLEHENWHSQVRLFRGWIEDLKAKKKLRKPL